MVSPRILRPTDAANGSGVDFHDTLSRRCPLAEELPAQPPISSAPSRGKNQLDFKTRFRGGRSGVHRPPVLLDPRPHLGGPPPPRRFGRPSAVCWCRRRVEIGSASAHVCCALRSSVRRARHAGSGRAHLATPSLRWPAKASARASGAPAFWRAEGCRPAGIRDRWSARTMCYVRLRSTSS